MMEEYKHIVTTRSKKQYGYLPEVLFFHEATGGSAGYPYVSETAHVRDEKNWHRNVR